MLVHRMTLLAATITALVATPASAQKQYGPGVSDTEIKIGQTIAYSGPASAYGTLGKVEAAYFKWLNDTKGGINGRKINFISRDDGYSPPKAVENVAQPGGGRRGRAGLRRAGHAAEHGDPALSEQAGRAATVRRRRLLGAERSRAFPLDDGLAAQFARRGEILRQESARPQSEAEDRACSTRTTISARIC